jgi:hypothetical protein
MVGALPGDADAAAQRRPDPADDIAQAIDRLRAGLEDLKAAREFSEIASLREAMNQFLRANQKWPDFIEVGVNVWHGVYDWHVRWQQPIDQGRDAGGRYYLRLLHTAIVLRPDTLPNFVSQPYDTR